MPRPNTSVRPPVHVGVRGRKLSDLLRAWRRQPRKRSPALFWSLVALTAGTDAAAVLVGTHLPRAAVPIPMLPLPLNGDVWRGLHLLAGASAGAALGLAWSVAAFALVRITLAPPDGERLARLAAVCVRAVAVGLALLVVTTVLGIVCAVRASYSPPSWDAPALGTLLALPCCAALVFVRRAGWLRPPGLLIACVLGLSAVVLAWHLAAGILGAWILEGILVNVALAAHAALRYYFGRQRIFPA